MPQQVVPEPIPRASAHGHRTNSTSLRFGVLSASSRRSIEALHRTTGDARRLCLQYKPGTCRASAHRSESGTPMLSDTKPAQVPPPSTAARRLGERHSPHCLALSWAEASAGRPLLACSWGYGGESWGFWGLWGLDGGALGGQRARPRSQTGPRLSCRLRPRRCAGKRRGKARIQEASASHLETASSSSTLSSPERSPHVCAGRPFTCESDATRRPAQGTGALHGLPQTPPALGPMMRCHRGRALGRADSSERGAAAITGRVSGQMMAVDMR